MKKSAWPFLLITVEKWYPYLQSPD
uniref:Uncharacterized protein n=1 Tax=Arundo donax TaxID=35708 RepID=A0A0A8YEY8_ARUDO